MRRTRILLAMMLSVTFAALLAQSAGTTPRSDAGQIPSYELVSIRKTPATNGTEPGIHDDSDGFRAGATSLRSLIAEAYGFSLGAMSDQQLTGAPAWARTELFDIRAKVDPDSVARLNELSKASTMLTEVRELVSRTPSFRMIMLQRLLEDRFHVKVHYEQKVMSLFEMTTAKGGVRLKPAHPTNPNSGSFTMSDGKLDGENVPMAFVPVALALVLERPVVDKTGVEGTYDLQLRWARGGQGAAVGVEDSAPSLFTAVQEQMGLKLNATKGPVWVVVVDHAELPSEN